MTDTIISTLQQEADLAFAQLKDPPGRKLLLRAYVNHYIILPEDKLVTFTKWYPGDRTPEQVFKLASLRDGGCPEPEHYGPRFKDANGFVAWRAAERRLSWTLAREELARLDAAGGAA